MWASWGATALLTVKWGQERQASMCAVLEGWREASEVEQG